MKMPFQVVLDTAQLAWEEPILSATDVEQTSAVQKMVETQARLETDCAEAPALRALLLKLADDAFNLILSVPRLCADARSLQVLVRELGLIYSGQNETLTEPFRYVQFAQWQPDLLESEEDDARRGREFWLKQAASETCPTLFFGPKKQPYL